MKLLGLLGKRRENTASAVSPRVVFVPNQGYTADALAAATPMLRKAGVSYGFCLEKGRPDYDDARSAIERLGETPHTMKELRHAAGHGDVWVFSLDMPAKRRRVIELLRSRGVVTIGVQEGCRPSLRDRYRYVDRVLVWGRYAARMFEDTSTIVGSPRLERLQREARPLSGVAESDVAVINLKGSVGPGYESRVQVWLTAAIDAVTRCGLRPIVSKHFHSADTPHDLEVNDGPVEEAVLNARVLISRPSTTVYEAMVLGRQPLLFPLEDDPLCEFHNPHGAFPICWNAAQLAGGLNDYLSGEAGFSHGAFLSEVFDHNPQEPAGDRMALAILDSLS